MRSAAVAAAVLTLAAGIARGERVKDIVEIEGVRDEYEESADNIREYFGDTYQTAEIDDKVAYLDDYIASLEDAKEEVDNAIDDIQALDVSDLASEARNEFDNRIDSISIELNL